MTAHPTIVESLRQEGYRLTPQRIMILDIINDSMSHISAEEIHRKVQEQYPFVNISTIYRTLNLLKKLRLISETDLGDGYVRYELLERERHRHHHLVCRQCGESFAFEDELLKPLQIRLLKEYGFAADVDHFAIFGLCQRCRRGEGRGGVRKEGQHGAD
ncbi:MAG: transcriptional repressor [Dehalococcoidia bacterium]|nr:MAG: transcriptional repressor [Dehalococcoidia bacterium]